MSAPSCTYSPSRFLAPLGRMALTLLSCIHLQGWSCMQHSMPSSSMHTHPETKPCPGIIPFPRPTLLHTIPGLPFQPSLARLVIHEAHRAQPVPVAGQQRRGAVAAQPIACPGLLAEPGVLGKITADEGLHAVYVHVWWLGCMGTGMGMPGIAPPDDHGRAGQAGKKAVWASSFCGHCMALTWGCVTVRFHGQAENRQGRSPVGMLTVLQSQQRPSA